MFWSAAALLLLTVGVVGDTVPASAPEPPRNTQRVVRERIVVRVPVRLRQIAPPTASLVEWREGIGPKCIRMQAVSGASIRGRNSVDLILKNNRRFRAKLENSCPALDYYFGFYIAPNPDGLICADRDLIRSRMGGKCGIEAFRSLQPMRRVVRRVAQQ